MAAVWAASAVDFALAHGPCAAKAAGAVLLGAVAVALLFRLLGRRAPRLVLREFSSGLVATVIQGDCGPDFVHKEMFLEADGSYFRHGVSLDDADTRRSAAPHDGIPFVLDVGANVGFFARQTLDRCPRVRIVCFEPVPILAEACRRNTQRVINGTEYAQSVKVHAVGLSDAAVDDVKLTCFPAFSATSCVDSRAIHSGASATAGGGLFQWLRAAVHDLVWAGVLPQWAGHLARAVLALPVIRHAAVLMAAPVAVFLLDLWHSVRGLHMVTVACPLRRLDAMLAADDLTARPIDLLKVDIEGAEWQMLMGMSDANWARVRQAVIEVHDVDGRLGKLQALLREKGFAHVVVGTEEMQTHALLGIYTVFARKDVPVAQE